MAYYDYGTQASQAQERKLAKFPKGEDTAIPDFAREIPLRTIVKKHGNSFTVEYEWSTLGGEQIKINFGKFYGDQNLENVHKISVKDGEEVGYFRIANATYIIRKTSESVAKEAFRVGRKIKASILGAIGYFRTVKGNFYTVSKIEGYASSLDSRTGLNGLSLHSMEPDEKRRLADLIMDEMIKIYKQGYALKNFSLGSIIVTKRRILLGDVSSLARAKAAKMVDNFLANLKAMVKGGIASRGDVVYGIALFFAAMKKEYAQWAKEKKIIDYGEAELLEMMETEVFS